MGARRARMLLVVTLMVGAGLPTGCGSVRPLHGGKLRPRVGVQAGWLEPLDRGVQEYGGDVIAGAALRIGANLATPVGLEVGGAYSTLFAEDASVRLLFVRARMLYAVGMRGFCLRFGGQMIQQEPEEYGNRQDPYTGGAIDLGFLLGQRLELGVNYSLLVGSENVGDTVEATLGINF